jgi:hypothetical protein
VKMTTGSDIADFRVNVSTDAGPGKSGSYWSRVWQGGDKPPTYHDDRALYLELANGTQLFLPRLPKRMRTFEHGYKMDLISYRDNVGKYGSGVNAPPTYTATAENVLGAFGFQSGWVSNDDLALLGKLREKVQGSTFNAAVFLAEGHQALTMIAHAASALDGAYRHAKRGDFASAGKSLAKYERNQGRGFKTLANNWLELQYGVLPLLSDVFDAACTVAKLTAFPLQQTVTVTRKVNGRVVPSSYWVTPRGSGFEAVKIKAIIREVNIPSLIGLSDPASVVWEKLPYSFVVDWFVPIGSYLAARGLSQSLSGTFVTTRTTKWSMNGFASNVPWASYDQTISSYRRREVHVVRSVSDNLVVPTPSIKPLGKAASWRHAANAIALLTQKSRL